MHGWFSIKQLHIISQRECSDSKSYSKPIKVYKNKDGKEVYVTMVTETLDHCCKFDDMKYMGEVFDFIKSI